MQVKGRGLAGTWRAFPLKQSKSLVVSRGNKGRSASARKIGQIACIEGHGASSRGGGARVRNSDGCWNQRLVEGPHVNYALNCESSTCNTVLLIRPPTVSRTCVNVAPLMTGPRPPPLDAWFFSCLTPARKFQPTLEPRVCAAKSRLSKLGAVAPFDLWVCWAWWLCWGTGSEVS